MATGKRAVIWHDGVELITTIVASQGGEDALRAKISAARDCEVREVTVVLNAEAARDYLSNPSGRAAGRPA